MTLCGPRKKPRSERAQERRATMTSSELGYELAFLPRLHAPPLQFAGLLEAQAHCPRPERLVPRSIRLSIIQARMFSLPLASLREKAPSATQSGYASSQNFPSTVVPSTTINSFSSSVLRLPSVSTRTTFGLLPFFALTRKRANGPSPVF
jgi:hypothetical protein